MAKLLVVLTILFSTSIAAAEDRDVHTDSKLISNFMKQKYTVMVEEYVEVFLGHLSCEYDFIDENIFNAIADNAIKDLAKKVDEVISSNPDYEFDDEQISYLSMVIALAVMDVHSSAESAQIRARMADGTITCENARQRHHEMYLKLAEGK